MGDAGASSTTGLAACSGLGDHGSGESACWLSMVRRHTARGGGIGGGRGGASDGVTDMDCSLSMALSFTRSSSANLKMC